jgi:ATP/maltotriose-dependent transcriptional regulator MalT
MAELTVLGEKLQDSDTELFGMVHLANTLTFATKADLAIEKGEKALARAEEHGNLKYQAEILTMGLPFSHLQRGEVETALSYVERGLEIAAQIGHHVAEVFAAIVQGKVAMGQGYYADALALFRRAEEAAQATGMPPYIALGKCVTGTCYSSIGGAYHQQATEIHTETLEISEMPMGDQMGAWVWSEIGHCALASGDVEVAEELFHRALDRRTVAMYISRPEALQGLIDVAVVRGDLEEARNRLDELREYVRGRDMTNALPALLMSEAKVAGAIGEHARAVEVLGECLGELAGTGFKRTELHVHAARVRELRALGDAEAASAARADFETVGREILSRVGNDDMRAAFGQSILDMVDEV